MEHRKVLFTVLVQIHFIQRKQFSETDVTSHFSTNFRCEDFSWMLPRAPENAVAGHMRPTGL